MSCLLHLRLEGSLVELARAMRVLKRYRIHEPSVAITREGEQEVAVVHGTLDDARHSLGLAGALSRIPGLLEAVISGDGGPAEGGSPRAGGAMGPRFNIQLNR